MTKRPLIAKVCQGCGHEQSIFGNAVTDDHFMELIKEFAEIQQALNDPVQSSDWKTASQWLTVQNEQPPTKEFIELHRAILQRQCFSNPSSVFVDEQLSAIKSYPASFCDSCNNPICLRCGHPDWHKSCLDYLYNKLQNLTRGDFEYRTIRWLIKHSKYCPRCYLLITRDEDGSCNQMQCNYCGYAFCWECLGNWGETCGYFKCSSLTGSAGKEATSNGSKKSQKSNRKIRQKRTEAGIPDVSKLPQINIRR